MWDETSEEKPRIRPASWIAALALLALYLAAAHSVFSRKNAGFEEIRAVADGWAYRELSSRRFPAPGPPLAKRILARGLEPANSKSGAESMAGWDAETALRTGESMFWGSQGLKRLSSARMKSAIFGCLLAFTVFLWSSRLWGGGGGVFSLALCAACPSMLGFGSMATPAMISAAFLYVAMYCYWRLHEAPALWRMMAAALAAAFAGASSYGGMGVFALLAAMSLFGLLFGPGFFPFFPPDRPESPMSLWGRMALNYAFALSQCGVIGYLMLVYLRHWDFSLDWLWRGLGGAMAGGGREAPIFYCGERSLDGFARASWWAFWMKIPLPILFAALIGVLCVRAARVFDAAYLIAMACFLLLGAMMWSAAGWHDELLPIVPALCVLAGAVFRPNIYPRALAALASFLALLILIARTLIGAPDHFAYANLLAGGSEGAASRFDAADRDRGRDSFALRRADSENPGAAWFIFSPSLPTGRYGAPRDAEDLLRKPEAIYFPEPGLYAVGLRALQSANPLGESAVRFHWLEEYRPAQILGAGLFLYRFEPAAGEPPGYDRKTGVCRIDIEALWQTNSPRLREILDANPDDETARRILAQGQMMWAREQIRRGLLESALQDALEARRSHPQPLEPALALAEIYYRLDRPEELADQIEDIERLDPLHRDIERHKAWLRDAHPEIAFRSGNPHPADAEVVSIEELESAEASGPEVLKIESLEGKVQPPAPE